MEYISHCELDTELIGENLAAQLHPGDVVAYSGGLSAANYNIAWAVSSILLLP